MSALRIRFDCELLLALILIFCYIWCIYPLHLYWPDAIFYSVAVIFLIYSRNRRRVSWRQLGFRFDNFIASGKTLLVITLSHDSCFKPCVECFFSHRSHLLPKREILVNAFHLSILGTCTTIYFFGFFL